MKVIFTLEFVSEDMKQEMIYAMKDISGQPARLVITMGNNGINLMVSLYLLAFV